MESIEIKKLSEKNFSLENLNEIKKYYEISYGKYNNIELKKAIDNKSPFYINKYFIIGHEGNKFISDNNDKILIERMVKAVIIESEKDDVILDKEGNLFAIINRNDWQARDLDISKFGSIFGNLRVGEIFLPPHSAVFNFVNPTEKETKGKIVSCLEGVNINVYSFDNYVDNCIHEVGHLFWRDCLKYKEVKKFEEYFKTLKLSAIYEYDWERSDAEEMFCTIYKWYLKSILINKSFYNILEFEEAGGLRLIQDVMDRIAKDRMVDDIWELKKKDVMKYLNPKFDITSGKRIVAKGLFEDIQDIELPDSVLNGVNRFQDGTVFVNLHKAVLPVKGNMIDWEPMEKAEKIKKTIFFDIDGVIANFSKGYRDAFGRNAYEDDSFTVNQFCQQVPHFFAMLPINEKGLELFNYLRNDYNIIFLTTPMDGMEHCKIDKIDWIRENIGEYDVLFSSSKSDFVVDSESILIDDMQYNLDPWKEAGGTGIKFPQKIEKILNTIEEIFKPEIEKKELTKIIINSDPTENQKTSGNYLKGNIEINNLKIKIENTPGSIRWGFSEIGQKWITKMSEYYGYITGTIGSDNDPVDVFINPKGVNRSLVFVINQSKDDGMFDEVKCMIGYKDEEEAKKAYLKNYTKGWEKNIISIKRTNTKKLRDWLELGNIFEPY